MAPSLLQKFLEFNFEKQLFKHHQRGVLAISGGLDSVVLLDLFMQIQQEYGLEIILGHLNHQLRGSESNEDERWVRQLGLEKGLQVISEPCDVRALAREKKISIEMAARECRYEFLQRIAQEVAADWIATGHQADDQAETILDHILRGTGVDGLHGILPRRDRLIRPLLFASRAEIEAYAIERQISHRVDRSNSDLLFRRNRIRHQLIPQIQQNFNPNIVKGLVRLGENMAELTEFLEGQTRLAFQQCVRQEKPTKIILDIIPFLAYFSFLKQLLLRHIFSKLSLEPVNWSSFLLRRCMTFIEKGKSGRSIRLRPGLRIHKSGQLIAFEKEIRLPLQIDIDRVPGKYDLWNGIVFQIEMLEQGTAIEYRNSNRLIEFIDAEQVVPPLSIRTLKRGDQFFPFGSSGMKKLSEFLIDAKIPEFERRQLPLLQDGCGIIWVCGWRLDDRYKITDKTKRVYQLLIKYDS